MSVGSISEYRAQVMHWLRQIEVKRCAGDEDKLFQLSTFSDAYLVRKWLWVFIVVGAPVVYLLVPFILQFLTFLPPVVINSLWTAAKGLMGIIFFTLLLAIYLTVIGFDENK